jgi:hypothetical protein
VTESFDEVGAFRSPLKREGVCKLGQVPEPCCGHLFVDCCKAKELCHAEDPELSGVREVMKIAEGKEWFHVVGHAHNIILGAEGGKDVAQESLVRDSRRLRAKNPAIPPLRVRARVRERHLCAGFSARIPENPAK